jgi:hypothetical protein
MKKALPYRILVWILRIIVMSFLTLLGLDFLLWHLDPLGMRALGYNIIKLAQYVQPHPTGYMYPPNTYELEYYRVTIVDDGKRAVPDSGSGDCVIAFVGDSMTWGQGVNDDETFANLLAINFPNVTIWNTARGGYGVENVAALIDHYEADGYIWLVYFNDAIPFLTLTPVYNQHRSALELYANLFVSKLFTSVNDDQDVTWGDHAPLAQSIVQREDLLAFGFEDDPLAREAVLWGAVLIPNPHDPVSAADGHPGVEGHQRIAENLLPLVTPFVEQQCSN